MIVTKRMNSQIGLLRVFGTLCLFFLLLTNLALAGDVILNPGYIQGQVVVGDIVPSQATIIASNSEYTAKTTIYQSNDYLLTVHTPETGSYSYSVGCTFQSDQGRNTIYLGAGSEPVDVFAGETSQHDLVLENPGFVSGTVIIDGPGELKYGTVYASYPGQGSYAAFAKLGTNGSENTFSFPVHPGDTIRLWGDCRIDINGTYTQYNLDQVIVNIPAGTTVTNDWTIPVAFNDATGSLSGRIAFNGAESLGLQKIGYGGMGPTRDQDGNVFTGRYRFDNLVTEADFNYIEEGLNIGSWRLSAYAYFDDFFYGTYGYPKFQFPLEAWSGGTQYVTIAEDETAVKDVVADAVQVSGRYLLTGSAANVDMGYRPSYLKARSSGSTGIGMTQIDQANQSYRLVLIPGEWSPYENNLRFYNVNPGEDEDYLDFDTSFYDLARRDNPLMLTAGNHVNDYDITYETGKVTVRFSVVGGQPLRSPKLGGYFQQLDELGNLQISGTLSARGPAESVAEGRVTFIGVAGTYTLEAFAYVDNSLTEFGQFTIEVEPAVEQEIDLEGPLLIMAEPEPNACIAAETVVVSGRATDDAGVTVVTVDGVEVAFTSTNNPDDPNEVEFSTVATLSPGENYIEIIAYDASEKTGAQLRPVRNDPAAPSLVSITPADGTVTDQSTITVTGVASDDLRVAAATINGQSVAISSSGNGSDPREVAFSGQVTLQEGDNPIVVAVQDECGKVAQQSISIAYRTNQPPVANAGPDQSVSAGSGCQSQVLLDGGGSSDPDNDPLMYSWSGPFGTVTGMSPQVTLPVGVHTLILTVDDGNGETAGDDVVVTVQDTNAPVIGIAGVVAGAEYTDTATAFVTITDNECGVDIKTILLDGQVYLSGTPITDRGAHTLAVTAADAAGNSAQASINFSILATTELSVTAQDGQYSDPSVLTATLTSGGEVIEGKTVVFNVAGQNAGSAVTGADGTATLTYAIGQPAGTYPVTAAFAKDSQAYLLPSNGSDSLFVTPEDASIAYTGSLLVEYPVNFTLAAKVTQSADGCLGDLGLARAVFDVNRVNSDGTLSAVGVYVVACNGSGIAQEVRPFDVGVYSITATIDSNGYYVPDSDAASAPVYDPNGGFVTAGGRIDVNDTAGGSLGKATFGFVVKYKDGGVTGNLEFQHHDGGMNLHSTSFSWMVISGNDAQFQGVGTINHQPGSYAFRVNCTDRKSEGLTDLLSIDVWEGDDMSAEPIYRAINMELSGGSVMVKNQ